MAFIDDVSSSLTLDAAFRRVRCGICKEVSQLSHERLEVALIENKFICGECQERRRTREPSRRKSKNN